MESQIQDQQSQSTSVPETQPQQTLAAATQVTAPESSTAEKAGATAATAASGEATSAYTPNFKFKVDKEEKEMDEWVRGAIKDAATEQKARELFEKGHGIEAIKSRLAQTREQYEAITKEYQPVQEGLKQLRQHVKNEDFDSFFAALNIPNQMVMQWVAKKLQYENLPPEEKRRYDETIELRREASRLQEERDRLASQNQSTSAQAKALELDYALQNPEINQVMRDFDARAGRIGAFRDEVVYHAIAREQATQKAISASEAVQSLLGLMGKPLGGSQTAQAPAANPQVNAPTPKPVITNIKARGGASPVKKHSTSLEDFKKFAQARIAELEG